VREGVVFLADEFNLLTPSVMLALTPFLSAHPGEVVSSPALPEPVTVAVGFLFVATGNEESERGRVKFPEYLNNLLKTVKV
jgi:MoxR-like ATPase